MLRHCVYDEYISYIWPIWLFDEPHARLVLSSRSYWRLCYAGIFSGIRLFRCGGVGDCWPGCVFAFLWARAKLFGKPFGPRAQFEAARRDMEAQFEGMDLNMERNGPREGGDGPIIDAHQTPEGWSVDD